MGIKVHLPTLGIVAGTAAIDSINPCAIGVLILMISVVLSGKGTVGRMLLLGGLYIFAIYLTYLSAGLGLVYFLASIPLFVTEYLSIIVGSFIILAGLIEIKDLTVPGVMILGAFVAGVELPCTGAPYLAIITILSMNFNLTAFLLLVIYNIIFVLPLLFF